MSQTFLTFWSWVLPHIATVTCRGDDWEHPLLRLWAPTSGAQSCPQGCYILLFEPDGKLALQSQSIQDFRHWKIFKWDK